MLMLIILISGENVWTALQNPDDVECKNGACDGQLKFNGRESIEFTWGSPSGADLDAKGNGELCIRCDQGNCDSKECNHEDDKAGYFCECEGI